MDGALGRLLWGRRRLRGMGSWFPAQELWSLGLRYSGLHGDWLGFRGVEQLLVVGGEEAAEVVDGVVRGGHLAEVVLPHVGLDGAAGEGLAGNMHDLAPGVDAGVGDGGNHEAHVRAGAPEAAGKVVGEEQGVMATLSGEQGEGVFVSGPDGADVGLEPAAEFESVKLSLIQQQTQQLFTIHRTIP